MAEDKLAELAAQVDAGVGDQDDDAEHQAPEVVLHKPLQAYRETTIAQTLNRAAGAAVGSTLPHDLMFGEAAAGSLEEVTGHTDVPPLLWLAGASVVLAVVWFMAHRNDAANEQAAAQAAPGATARDGLPNGPLVRPEGDGWR